MKDIAFRLQFDVLLFNFEEEDILEHYAEIIEQLWYEASIENITLVPVEGNV